MRSGQIANGKPLPRFLGGVNRPPDARFKSKCPSNRNNLHVIKSGAIFIHKWRYSYGYAATGRCWFFVGYSRRSVEKGELDPVQVCSNQWASSDGDALEFTGRGHPSGAGRNIQRQFLCAEESNHENAG